MKSILIVDWDNLKAVLKRLGFSHSPRIVATKLRDKAAEFVESEKSKLDGMEVYASPSGFGTPDLQEIWIQLDYKLHTLIDDPEITRQEIYGDVLNLIHNKQYDVYIIATGDVNQAPLVRRVEAAGAQCHVWIADGRKPRTGRSPHVLLPDFLELPGTKVSNPDITDSTTFEGVLKVIGGEIIRRTQKQLENDSRKYSTTKKVDAVFDSLSSAISASGFRPDAIVAWIDQTRHWNGSETVATELSKRFSCGIVNTEVREEGERRDLQSYPDLSAFDRVLIVDDAAFSGATLEMLVATLQRHFQTVKFRTAVLSAKDPVVKAVNYYGDTHSGDDVLFPWGWARTINQFYDLLRHLGTHDKRWMPRVFEFAQNRMDTTVIEDQISTLEILSTIASKKSGAPAVFENEFHDTDELIYIISGETEIRIGDASGTFVEEEFLFVPRVVPYQLTISEGGKVLRVLFRTLIKKD